MRGLFFLRSFFLALAIFIVFSCRSRLYNASSKAHSNEDNLTLSSFAESDSRKKTLKLPLTNPVFLAQPIAREAVRKIKESFVVYANYELIRIDFPRLSKLSNQQLDSWLQNQAYVSVPQSSQVEFNSAMEFEESNTSALRPRDYGRAVVLEVFKSPAAYIDSKGSGSNNPKYDWEDGDPRTGTYTLGEAIREYLYTEILDWILQEEKSKFSVVGCYAVLFPKFDVIHRNSRREITGRDPAGILLRRAHERFENPSALNISDRGKYFLWDEKHSKEAEQIFRKYGITSEGSGRKKGESEGGVNIQGTSNFEGILDFGNYVVRESFPRESVPHFYGTNSLFPLDDKFPQPIKAKALQESVWGKFSGEHIDSKTDRAWVYAHETAKAIAEHVAKGNLREAKIAARNHRFNMLDKFSKAMNRSQVLPPKD
jgi:hypothetical protein